MRAKKHAFVPDEPTLKLLSHQMKFAHDEHEFVALVGGLGCGKSYAIGAKLYVLAYRNQGFPGMLITRSGKQMHNLMVEVEKVFQSAGLDYLPTEQFKKSELPLTYTLFDGKIYMIRWDPGVVSEIYCETAENRAYTRWAGGNRAFAVIDEIDTMPSAEEVWSFAGDRVRIGPFNQIACASTPEGYGFLWEFFEDKPAKNPKEFGADRIIIRGCSFDNPHINKSWLKRQIQTRDAKSLRAYFYGEFVNLEGSLVYHRFNKHQNTTHLTLNDFDRDFICHVGVDWNKNINAACICIVKDGYVYVVDECFGATDASELISQLTKKLYGRPIKVYPDASGYEAIRQFERAYGTQNIIYNPANPDIDVRVATVNERLATPSGEARILINEQKAPHLYSGLARQVKDKSGKPDKTKGLDHSCDGFGYFIHQFMPLNDAQGTAVTYNR